MDIINYLTVTYGWPISSFINFVSSVNTIESVDKFLGHFGQKIVIFFKALDAYISPDYILEDVCFLKAACSLVIWERVWVWWGWNITDDPEEGSFVCQESKRNTKWIQRTGVFSRGLWAVVLWSSPVLGSLRPCSFMWSLRIIQCLCVFHLLVCWVISLSD